MKTKIELDWKSAAIGVAATALVMFATGAAGEGPIGNIGRFEVSVGGDGRAAVVDTMTGQTWTAQIPTSGLVTIGTATFSSTKIDK